MKNKFPPIWQDQLDQLDFNQFTPIQEKAFEPIRDGKSVLGISPTGTGKTLAYLWPLLSSLTSQKAQQILILAPNTELAGQIFDVAKAWAEPLNLTCQVLISGSSQKRQIERLKKGPQIIIGTPGRIWELIKIKKLKMMAVDKIVLDEFDQLFEESQAHFVNHILNHAPRDYQLIYMSATDKYKKDLIAEDVVTIDVRETTSLSNIDHYYLDVSKRDKIDLLRKMSNIPDFRGLVFFNSLSDLGASDEKLTYRSANVVSLASDVNVKFRKVILEKFKANEINLLLATDLVARGIDIDNLECVINFDVPRDLEVYTHRSGRTGRMGKNGAVITLVSHPEELKKLKKYAKVQAIRLKNQDFIIED
ncbi:DEAD/DEAH box helicase [Streptococcus moroccensis]|uniref:Superfamily II DNA/RNA helicase n=1 Tax=Streptococcus moroccensis TaxID=1451356 RepID=A0ABT9YTC2_9STRE|nr:DEAD/DEAH box helicase [Streptococcus moroccensis]MDQ0223246.1 superfamily II DNA/RNA helicase [Streptococcus moroccensis]